MKNIPILNYIWRYKILLAAIAAIILAYMNGSIALSIRGAMIMPMFIMIAAAGALLLRNVYNRSTTDKYVDNKAKLQLDWDGLTGFQRILLTKLEFIAYFLGACAIGLGLLVNFSF